MTNLQQLPEAIREQRFMQLVEWIIKYQKFNANAAFNKIGDLPFSSNTAKQYFQQGTTYLSVGTKYSHTSERFYNALDKYRHIFQALTPTPSERRIQHKRHLSSKKPAIATLPCINTAITECFQWGVRIDNTVRIFERQEVAQAFIDGMHCVDSSKQCKLIMIKCEEV